MTQNKTVTKKVPTRRCTGCGEHFPKNVLVRVLRTPEGEIILDDTGKKSGRGAYICRDVECLKKARRSGRIGRSLDVTIPEEVYDRMERELCDNEQ